MLDPDTIPPQELANRIRETIAASRFTKSEIAEALGVTPQAVNGWETTGRIGKNSLAGLAKLTGKTVEDFVARYPSQSPRATEWIDVLGYSQAVGLGKGAEAQEYAETHKLKFKSDSFSRKRLSPQALAVMYGSGDSMEPRIHDGDAVLFDFSDTTPRDDTIFVVQWRGEYFAKRCEILDDIVFFKSDNPRGDHHWNKPKRMDSKRDPVTVIGRVRWIGSWED